MQKIKRHVAPASRDPSGYHLIRWNVADILGVTSSTTLRKNARCTWRPSAGVRNVHNAAIRHAISPLRPSGRVTPDVHGCSRGGEHGDAGANQHPLIEGPASFPRRSTLEEPRHAGAPPWRARSCPTRHNPQVLPALVMNATGFVDRLRIFAGIVVLSSFPVS